MYDFYFDGFVDIAFGDSGDEKKLKRWKLNPKIQNIDRGPFTFDIVYEQTYETKRNKNTDPVSEDFTDKYSQYYTKHSSFLSVATVLDLGGDLSYHFTPAIGANYGYQWEITDGANDAVDESGNFVNREDPFGYDFASGFIDFSFGTGMSY